jgi:hypothetical protein
MTPVRPVGTSSATLPRRRRPLGLRAASFAQILEDEAAVGPERANATVPSTTVGLIEAEDVALDAATAVRAFQHADSSAARRVRHSGQVLDVSV